MKRSASVHGNRLARVMSQNKNGGVIGRVVSPPSFPLVIRPRTADGPEHIAPQDPGPYVAESARGKVVVTAGLSALDAEDLPLKFSGREEPLMERAPANAQRVLQALVRAGSVAVERYRETLNAKFGHPASF